MSYIDQKRQWLKDHPNATADEAYSAGYWQSCDNWCKKTK
jgi:hypothetical protein